MKAVINTVFLVTLLSYTFGEDGKLPSFIKKCNYKDKKLGDCIRLQMENSLPYFTKGIPELGVPSTDPVLLDDIHINGNGLNLTLTETAMHGLSESKLTQLNSGKILYANDSANEPWRPVIHYAAIDVVNLIRRVGIDKEEEDFNLAFKGNLNLTAKYNIDGRILILPIQGNGDALVKANNIEVNIQSTLARVKDSKGRSHLKIINPNYKYEIESTTFDFKNLFNGNKELAQTTIAFANENWRQLMDDLAPPAIKQIVRTVIKGINKFFAKIPISDLMDEFSEP